MSAAIEPETDAARFGRPRRRLVLGIVGITVVVAIVASGIRLARLHNGWGPWGCPSAGPSVIRFEGRDYDRGGPQPDGIPSGYVPRGETACGGEIYQSRLDRGTSIVILVEDDQQVYAYGLIGGP